MTTLNLITVPAIAQAPTVPTINAEGDRVKAELLARSENFQLDIADVATRDMAVDCAGSIKGHLDAVENTRVEIGLPFYRMKQAIDEVAKKHVVELKLAMDRINRMVGAFNAEQKLKAQREQDERDRAARELQRIAAEEAAEVERKLAEERRIAAEAEAKRKAAEAKAAAKGKELTDAQKAKQLEQQLAEQERLEKIEQDARDRQAQLDAEKSRLQMEHLAAVERQRQDKAHGGSQRTEIDIEVTDAKLLYQSHPACVKLVPDLAAIKYLVNTQSPQGSPELRIPGVIWSRRAVFSSRAR